MKKIGFVDYYLDEWHANNYPEWIEKANGDFKVTYAWAEIEHSLATGASTDEWCERMNIQRIDTIEELCEKSDYIVVLAPSDPEKHLEYAKRFCPTASLLILIRPLHPTVRPRLRYSS